MVKQSTARKGLDLGLRNYCAQISKRRGAPVRCRTSMCLALPASRSDVAPDLARATIGSVSVLGALHATPAVKAALADRTRVNTMLNQDTLREAARLTRAGQLAEATALLQRMLQGEHASAAASVVSARRSSGQRSAHLRPQVHPRRQRRTQSSGFGGASATAAVRSGQGRHAGSVCGMPSTRQLRSATSCLKERNSSTEPTATWPEAGPTSCSSTAATNKVAAPLIVMLHG